MSFIVMYNYATVIDILQSRYFASYSLKMTL